MTNEEHIKSLPKAIQDRMMECQVEQGNKADISVFYNTYLPDINEEGFRIAITSEKHDFWFAILGGSRNYTHYYTKYPKQQYVKEDSWNIKIGVASFNTLKELYTSGSNIESNNGYFERFLTDDEIAHLDDCIKANKYVEITKCNHTNFSIGDKVVCIVPGSSICKSFNTYIVKMQVGDVGIIKDIDSNNISIYNEESDCYYCRYGSRGGIDVIELYKEPKFKDGDYVVTYSNTACTRYGRLNTFHYIFECKEKKKEKSWWIHRLGKGNGDSIRLMTEAEKSYYKKCLAANAIVKEHSYKDYNEGDLVVISSKLKTLWIEKDEVIKLGGKYWCNNDLRDGFMAKSKNSPNGMEYGSWQIGIDYTLRKATKKEILNSIWYVPEEVETFIHISSKEELDAVLGKIDSLQVRHTYEETRPKFEEGCTLIINRHKEHSILTIDYYNCIRDEVFTETDIKDFLGDFPISKSIQQKEAEIDNEFNAYLSEGKIKSSKKVNTNLWSTSIVSDVIPSYTQTPIFKFKKTILWQK